MKLLKSTFRVDKMDCPSEQSVITMRLEGVDGVVSQSYDLKNRTVTVVHSTDISKLEESLHSLKFGSKLVQSIETQIESDGRGIEHNDRIQRGALWWVLSINLALFAIEMTTGIISKSMGLVADSLDMLADASVYGLSLLAVGAVIARKKRVALVSGYLQIALAVFGFTEITRRFIGLEQVPNFKVMIGISLLALVANIISLIILQRTRSGDAHIRASVICSSNDVIVNSGVIVAGILVWQLGSNLPDLIIGSIVLLMVIRGALRILKLAK